MFAEFFQNKVNIAVFLVIALMVYIFGRNIYLIAEGFSDDEPGQAKAIYQTLGTVFLAFLGMVLLMHLVYYADLHVAFLVVAMLAVTLVTRYITRKQLQSESTASADAEIDHEDDFEKYFGIQLNYKHRQMFKKQEYQQLAASLRAEIGKGKWFIRTIEAVSIVGSIIAAGWLYRNEGVVAWNIGLITILAGIVFVGGDEMDKNLRNAAAYLEKM